ncbi:hypothetical protein LUZ63_015497 [Rhynchospora breviuscula]|uniref:Adenylosuccinate lyase n=1 Tax=Rhynchospora breviuscula TaxID=2022672 RepID=A0A9Q0CCP6_9POAL|nr:hypothetical protein LUZ63_015497 [Rhynchospora breviuscula]
MQRYPGFLRRHCNAVLTLASRVPVLDTEISYLDYPLIDSRDKQVINELQNFCGTYAFNYCRVFVEVRWLLKLSEIPEVKEIPIFSQESRAFLENIIYEFNMNEALEVNKIEEATNYDAKAILYYLKQKCKSDSEVSKVLEFFPSMCSLEDINHLAYGLLVKDAIDHVIFPVMTDLCKAFCAMARNNAHILMLSHTHGQASPTTLGKEMATFAFRLGFWAHRTSVECIFGNFSGVVGNYNACKIAYPDINWPRIAQEFVTSLGLQFNPYATQLESHHYMVELCDNLVNFNNVLADFTDEVRSCISRGYFEQKRKEGKTESCTMPRKLDPFNFANCSGNLSMANGSLSDLSKLICTSHRKTMKAEEIASCTMPSIDFGNGLSFPMVKEDLSDISRNCVHLSEEVMQSDLTNMLLFDTRLGLVHSLVAYKKFLKAIEKLQVNQTRLAKDLDKNWAVLVDTIQTVMERYAVPEPYEKLKELTRGGDTDKESISSFIRVCLDRSGIENRNKKFRFACLFLFLCKTNGIRIRNLGPYSYTNKTMV